MEQERQPLLDNLAIAGLYSQLTGVLAGFAFAGLLLILTHQLEHARTGESSTRLTTAMRLLLSAFVGLVLASLSYALISGEQQGDPMASLEHVIAGTGFGVATMLLLLAVLELVGETAPTLQAQVQILAGIALPVVVLLYVVAGVAEVGYLVDSLIPLAVGAALLALLGLAIVLLWSGRVPQPGTGTPYQVTVRAGMFVPLGAALAVPVLATLGGSGTTDAADMPIWLAYLAVGITFLFALTVAVVVAQRRHCE